MHVGRWEGNFTCALGCQTLAKTFHTHTLSLRAYTFTLFAVTCFYTSFKREKREERKERRGEKKRGEKGELNEEKETMWRGKTREESKRG